jgi:acetylornithine/N-succinyldiaminopimelate aminotransferase
MTRAGVTDRALLDQLRGMESRHIMATYARQPVAFVRGDGVRLHDAEGREYIDLVAGIAVCVLGHCPPAVRDALAEQASTLVHVSNLYYTEPQLHAARLLVESAFPSRVFFCNSGAEANETAVKIARKWGQRHRGGAHRIVCADGAFHGRTLAMLSATGNQRYLAPFVPTVEGFVHVPHDDAEAIGTAIDGSVAAVMLEPILGESGIVPMRDETLRRVRELCDERDVLLILDEVQTGMGRTGRMWAHQHAGVLPDVMTVAKGLGGGVPIGAVLAAPRADVLEPGDHGCTFGGNPLATAVAAAVLRTIVSDGLVENAARVGQRLREHILAMTDEGLGVTGVRGRGLMLAVLLADDIAPQVALAGLQTGVVVNAVGGRVLRLVPPLVLDEADADEAMSRLRKALRIVAAGGDKA